MSNHLAIAAVTATLRAVAQHALAAAGFDASALATTARPDDKDNVPARGVNVYLYRVSPNADWRNADLPTRRATGELVRRPQTALDLHYLFNFYGDDKFQEPQRMLGAVSSALHAAPALDRGLIRDTAAVAVDGLGVKYLADADLADQPLVHVTPEALSLEELSKLWSVFFQTHYVLSVSYTARVVLIEAAAPLPAIMPPPRTVRVDGVAAAPPVLLAIDPRALEFDPAAVLSLRGRHLAGAARFTSGDRPFDPGSTGEAAVVRLPADIRAGPNTLRVVSSDPLDPPHVGRESNSLTFMILPRLDAVRFLAGPARVEVDATPAVGPSQAASLILTAVAGPGPGFTISGRGRAVESDPLAFSLEGVPAGSYSTRLRVDGAESKTPGILLVVA